MLFELVNTTKENVDKLLNFAKKNHLKLSALDDVEHNFYLPGKPLTPDELSQLIENSRRSGTISIDDAHSLLKSRFNAG